VLQKAKQCRLHQWHPSCYYLFAMLTAKIVFRSTSSIYKNTSLLSVITNNEKGPILQLTVMEYLCDKWPFIVNTSRSFPHSLLITRFVTRLTRQVPLVEQELLTLPEHMISPLVFNEVRVTRSLFLCVCFVDHRLSFCTFSFGYCVVCSSIYGFWLPLFGRLMIV
jgi:branched-subunit amino acid transport protein